MSRRSLLAWLAAGAASLVTGVGLAGAYSFRVERRSATIARLRAPLRVALLADLHYGPFIGSRSVARWVDAALELEPDLIALDGDLVDYRAGADIDGLVSELARLSAPLGVYAVWGNHDHARYRDLTPFAARLQSVGIEVLVNRGVTVRPDVYLAGIDDLRRGRPDLAAAIAGRGDGACLLLSHNPDVLPEVPETVDLTLCGHTHGGQVCLPGFGALVTSSHYGRRFAQGWVHGPARGYVTRGLGVSMVPLRLDCPAELTLLDLRPPAGVGTAPA
jgi:hypothetical protein